MSDPNPESTTDRVRDALSRAADDLTLDAASPADAAHRGTRRRRRRRTAFAGTAAVVAVVAVGAVVGTRDRGDDTIELSTPDTSEPTTTTEPASPGSTTPPTTAPITTPPTLAPAVTVDAPAVAVDAGLGPNDQVTQLLPWGDGFLSMAFRYEPQPLPPLDDEITALFPDEVSALFPDGTPPTIDEAIEVLDEAGLLDEVSEILAAHPEVSDAISIGEPPPPVVMASYTVDGAEWTTTELTLPTPYPGQFTVSDDRLIMWSSDPVGAPEEFSGPRELTIAATTDLETWQTTTIALDVEPPESPAVRNDVFVNSLAVVGDRWLALVARHAWVDYESLLPDDVRSELQTSSGGYGINPMADRLEIEVFTENGTATVEYSFTWAELGLEGQPQEGPGDGDTSMLTGVFGGDHEEVRSPGTTGFGTVASLGDRFVLVGDNALGNTAQVSTDGRTWTELEGLPDGGFWQTVVPVSGGHLFVGDGPSGPFASLRLNDGTFTDAAMPELSDRYGIWNQSGSAAWIVEVGEPPQPDWEPFEIVVEHDGFVLTLLEAPDGSVYTLADATTGDVVRSGDLGGADGAFPDPSFEYDMGVSPPAIVISDDDGVEIVRIPGEVFDEAVQAAVETNEPDRTVAVEAEFDDWRPDLWMIATGDGVDWLTVDLEAPDPDTGFWPVGAAVNNGSVLYQSADGWVLEPLPS